MIRQRPILVCEAGCGPQKHQFTESNTVEMRDSQGREYMANELIYTCEECGDQRRWGLINATNGTSN